MNIGIILRVISLVCFVVSLFMLPSMCISLIDGTDDASAFFLSTVTGIVLSTGVLFTVSRKDRDNSMGIREGVMITVFSWLSASFLGALPYKLSGRFAGYTDAFFETMSGFTTTGATILPEIETLPRGILLWRSVTHWLGGMGIIVLSLAVLPFLGVSGMEMYKAEVPGVTAGKLTPRLHDTALYLWGMYILLTVVEAVLLMLGGMSIFDAVCHSFSTIATGGFSTKNASIAYFDSAYIQWVITVFMFLSGVNFSLYFLIPSGKLGEILADEELRGYCVIIVTAVLGIMLSLYRAGMFEDFGRMLRHTVFTVVSVITTTGFIVEDFDYWPDFSRFIILMIMFIGASGGSTGGGFKVSRIIIIFRNMTAEINKLLHPRAIIYPRLNGKIIPSSTLNSSTAFLTLYIMLLIGGTLISAAFGLDFMSAVSGTLTCISNVGPGFNRLGSVEHFGFLPDAVKWVYSFCMLAGRLELFAVFLVLTPKTYRR